jgi:hypothetical protein
MKYCICDKTKHVLQKSKEQVLKDFNSEKSIFLGDDGNKDFLDFVDKLIIKVQAELPQEIKKDATLLDIQLCYLETELHTYYINLINENEYPKLQLQYSDWDCGLACLSMMSNFQINAIDEYIKHLHNANKKGIPMKYLQTKLQNIGIETKIIREVCEIKKFQFEKKGIYIVGIDKNKSRNGAHYIYSDGAFIFDSEFGVIEIDKYASEVDYNYIIAYLQIEAIM